MAKASRVPYVGWEEVVVSGEKGRREVHYYLKRGGGGGGADLVVVGKEKSARRMSYHYVKDRKSLLSNINRSSLLKLRSRKEVIDWLSSILSDEDEHPNCPLRQLGSDVGNKYDADLIKDVQINKFCQSKPEFRWLGSPWTCRKRRRHYPSFSRNGVIISVHNFVYVLAEENKRLVAYLDDIYEDPRGNKMVVVRWFHKIDEVGFVLPRNYNDREIFFSLCLQDLSTECIDGLATVLSPEHYEKFMTKATQMGLAPFVCCRQIDNDDVKPFDVTRVKGYWNQTILKNASSPAYEPSDTNITVKRSVGDAVGCRPNKKIRWSEDCVTADKRFAVKTGGTSVDTKGGIGSLKEGCSTPSLSGEDNTTLPTCMQYLTIGSHVEVLSQDSGVRGCWFRALIVKKRKDKVKVQYQEVKDADDDAKNLEEWVLASRLAAPDALGIRVSGRCIVRPIPLPVEGRISSSLLNVGSIVDAWWHDGWWEGIVVKKEAEDKLHVYFPGEKQKVIFSPDDLRHSQEWVKNEWQRIKERPEFVSKLHDSKTQLNGSMSSDISQKAGISRNTDNEDLPQKEIKFGIPVIDTNDKNIKSEAEEVVRDLSKDGVLSQLKWKSSGKRRRSRSPVHKVHYVANGNSDCSGMLNFDNFFINSSLKFDQDNCKYAGDFSSSVVPPLTNLVMSR